MPSRKYVLETIARLEAARASETPEERDIRLYGVDMSSYDRTQREPGDAQPREWGQ